MKLKPTILVIENSIDVTGALKSISQAAGALQSFFDFKLVVPKKSKTFVLGKDVFLDVYKLPMLELSRNLYSILLYLPYLAINAIRLNRIIRQNKIALIHVNDIYNLLPLAIRLLGNTTPYICHVRFMPDRFPALLLKIWLKLHLRFAAKIIVVSEAVKNQLPPHSNIVVVYDNILVGERYISQFEGSSQKESYTFLYLSNFIQGKGHLYAIDAFSRVSNQLPNWRLRFVGGDMGLEKNRRYLNSLKQKAQELNIAEKVEWAGFTNDVEKEYKKADIVLNFSESESFSMTCLEALYFGRPMIATDCGGPAEIIEQMETGYLVSNRNLDAMTEVMVKMALDQDLRKKMGMQAKISVRSKFSFENTTFRLKEIYIHALK